MIPSAEEATLRLEDPRDFRVFYRDALPRIYGYFMNRCGKDRAVVEDLTQETFMAAVQAVKKGLRVDDPTSWVLGIARHKLVDHYRSRERDERADSWAIDRYQQGPGQVDRLWILDVDSERLVVDAMYMPSTDAEDRRELWQVMESIRFET